MDGRNCYNYLDICTYRPDCPGDHRDEMGCKCFVRHRPSLALRHLMINMRLKAFF